jgi:uncharacterized protein involved in exopolysaccharide biosynthesis
VPQELAQPPGSDLRAYLAIVRYRKWTIVLIAALVLASALFFSLWQTPIYESEARVLVRPSAPAPGVPPPPVNSRPSGRSSSPRPWRPESRRTSDSGSR